MPNIKPISDLKNHTEILKELSDESPVFLTRNRRDEYAVLDMEEYDKLRATVQLMSKLEKSEQSARENGWLSSEDAMEKLGL